MLTCRSVNETLTQLDELHGMPVEVEGVLDTWSEGTINGYELLHYPKVERRTGADKDPTHQSSLWLHFGIGSIQPNRSVLARWVGKRVRVHGIVYCAKSLNREFEALSDPLSIWPVHLEVYSVQRVTSDQRKEDGA
jgi:hypothetical protein